VLPLAEAVRLTRESGLDLIEISPNAKPPVARIMSYDKFRYQEDKKEKKQRLSQKTKELKHVQITPRAAQNDLDIRARQTEKFLEEGHKVEIRIVLRGRENANKDWSLMKLKNFLTLIKIPFQVTMEARLIGRGFITQIGKK